jgi:uncharacterized beta-barrel protein YwiB (DUF1934 family)
MKDIMLKIIGKQITLDGGDEQMEFITEGKYHEEGGHVLLQYDESDLSGMEGCTTSLKIMDGKVKMERSGGAIGLDAAIEFEQGRRFKGYYDTPFGSIEMEVLTNFVVNKIERKNITGYLDIDYNISLKGLSESRSRLKIEIMRMAGGRRRRAAGRKKRAPAAARESGAPVMRAAARKEAL